MRIHFLPTILKTFYYYPTHFFKGKFMCVLKIFIFSYCHTLFTFFFLIYVVRCFTEKQDKHTDEENFFNANTHILSKLKQTKTDVLFLHSFYCFSAFHINKNSHAVFFS